jgi:hypothetical protein
METNLKYEFVNIVPPDDTTLFVNIVPPDDTTLFVNIVPPDDTALCVNIVPPDDTALCVNIVPPDDTSFFTIELGLRVTSEIGLFKLLWLRIFGKILRENGGSFYDAKCPLNT